MFISSFFAAPGPMPTAVESPTASTVGHSNEESARPLFCAAPGSGAGFKPSTSGNDVVTEAPAFRAVQAQRTPVWRRGGCGGWQC